MSSSISLDFNFTDILYILALLYRMSWSVARKIMRPTYFAEFSLSSTFPGKHETLWHRHGDISVEVITDLSVFWFPPLILQQPSWRHKAARQLSAVFRLCHWIQSIDSVGAARLSVHLVLTVFHYRSIITCLLLGSWKNVDHTSFAPYVKKRKGRPKKWPKEQRSCLTVPCCVSVLCEASEIQFFWRTLKHNLRRQGLPDSLSQGESCQPTAANSGQQQQGETRLRHQRSSAQEARRRWCAEAPKCSEQGDIVPWCQELHRGDNSSTVSCHSPRRGSSWQCWATLGLFSRFYEIFM